MPSTAANAQDKHNPTQLLNKQHNEHFEAFDEHDFATTTVASANHHGGAEILNSDENAELEDENDRPQLSETQYMPQYDQHNSIRLENPYNDETNKGHDQDDEAAAAAAGEHDDEYKSNDHNGHHDNQHNDSIDKTFITQVGSENQTQISDEELIARVEQQMLEYERTAQYIQAEKARLTLSKLKSQLKQQNQVDLQKIQSEDIKIFFNMIHQHQVHFDRIWNQKTLEHKLRADDLIDSLKYKHDEQQRLLYEVLRKKRMPKFSVELLNMRKRQVMLAKSKNYLAAEKLKRKCDLLESIEIERIREYAKQENQARFSQLLLKQESERISLSSKLKIEKKCLLEAKSQDFIRLKKRLKNAEQELKKTHIRQQLMTEKKMNTNFQQQQQQNQHIQNNTYSQQQNNNHQNSNNQLFIQDSNSSNSSNPHSTNLPRDRGSVLRNSGRQNISSASRDFNSQNNKYQDFNSPQNDQQSANINQRTHKSVRELAKMRQQPI